MNKILSILAVSALSVVAAYPAAGQQSDAGQGIHLVAEYDVDAAVIRVSCPSADDPLLVQNVRPDFRPFIHPIAAPDGRGQLTEYSPGHHPHQTGLYWGFTRVNGRDYFHHPGNGYWRRVSAAVIKREARDEHDFVEWQTVYELLDESSQAVLQETQAWRMSNVDNRFVMELKWEGKAIQDVTIGKYDYGGLFLRMPWREGLDARVFNSARQENDRAEGQRAVWVDVGVKTPDRDDMAHIAIFDHPENKGFPQPWRVDGQFGVGPVRSRLGDWSIPAGETEVIRHQLVAYTGNLNDVELTELWADFSGQGMAWAQWNIARREGREAEFLTPEAAVEAMTVADGFKVNVFAAEPTITQPMAFCWDDRGRLWIAENRDYETRQTGFSGSGDSRILILEDTDRDGQADSRKIFAEGIPFPAAMATGFDGLWLGAPPNLLFVPDRDHNDRADTDDIEVRLTGWGIRDRHETLNSFHWGPDGWLYGLQGFATPSRVGKPVDKGRVYGHQEPFPDIFDDDFEWDGEPVDINGGVWRYHPTKDRFEVVAHGFSNPWGIDYDSKGQLFITACVIPHLWHVIPGGIYHRQGGSHFNPFVYSDIRTIADHRHRSAHGGARVYLSDAFPEKYHGRLFMANIHEHTVLTDVLDRQGSGFVGRHGDDFLLANNAQWIGFSVEIGPDGGVYVLDWHDGDICGMDVLNKGTGRVFRVVPSESQATEWAGRYDDLRTLADLQLADLQIRESAWHARRARVILQHRATQQKIDDNARGRLSEMFDSHNDADIRLRAMWTLHVIGALDEATLLDSLADQDEYVRAWAIQLLCEDRPPTAEVLVQMANMATSDPSPVVRLYVAAALQRTPVGIRWPVLSALVGNDEDADDHNLSKMIWFALEPGVVQSPHRALRIAVRSRLPSIARFVARRLSDDRQFDDLVAVIAAVDDSNLQAELLLGMRDGLEGEANVSAPEGWPDVYEHLQSQGGQPARLALQLSQQFGDKIAAESLLQTVLRAEASMEDRIDALRALAASKHARGLLEEALPQLFSVEALHVEAIRAAAALDSPSLGDALLGSYGTLSDEKQLEVLHAMAAQSGYGRQLTEAIRDGKVPRRDVPAYVARLLHRTVGNGFLEVWGPVESLAPDISAAFVKYRNLAASDLMATADPSHGRTLFERTCSACHSLYGEGGRIGPDLTGANRGDIEYLLGNILTPSAVIQDDYKMLIVLTDEGRIHSGVLAGENERQLRLRVPGNDMPVAIAKSTIESREISDVSIMPERMLDALTDVEAAALLKYLQSSTQVPLPDLE